MYYQTYVMQKNTYPTGRDSVDNSYSGVATFGPRVDELPPTNSVSPALRGGTFSNRNAELDVDDEMADPLIAYCRTGRKSTCRHDRQPLHVGSRLRCRGRLSTRGTVRHSERVSATSKLRALDGNPNPPNIDALGPEDDGPDHISDSDSAFEENLRRSERLKVKRQRAFHASLSSSLCTFGEAGRQAALAEVRQMLNKGIFVIIDPTVSVRTIPS
jgi:hypothetical protein